MPHRRQEAVLREVNLLELAPIRVAAWKEVGERVVVQRPQPAGQGLRGLGERLSYLLSVKRIRLDELGSFAWKRLDGKTTVARAAQAMREQFGERAEPAEARLGHFVRLLRQEGLVRYPGWDEGES